MGNNRPDPQYVISTKLTLKEKARFVEIAEQIDLPPSHILRQLIRYLLNGQIQWLDLLEKTNTSETALPKDKAGTQRIRVSLPLHLYTVFAQYVEKKDSTTPKTLRRLVLLYISGSIDSKEIWTAVNT